MRSKFLITVPFPFYWFCIYLRNITWGSKFISRVCFIAFQKKEKYHRSKVSHVIFFCSSLTLFSPPWLARTPRWGRAPPWDTCRPSCIVSAGTWHLCTPCQGCHIGSRTRTKNCSAAAAHVKGGQSELQSFAGRYSRTNIYIVHLYHLGHKRWH